VLFPELQKAICKSGIYGEDQELLAKLKKMVECQTSLSLRRHKETTNYQLFLLK